MAKVCSKCKADKNISDFSKNRSRKDGLEYWCKSCKSAYEKPVRDSYRSKPEVREKERRQASKWQKDKTKNCPEYWMYWSARQRAKKRGLEFTIVVGDIHIPEFCPILNIRLSRNTGPNGVRGPASSSPSLDRIDSRKGYTKENIQVISNRANTMKSDATLEELALVGEWAKTLMLEKETDGQ